MKMKNSENGTGGRRQTWWFGLLLASLLALATEGVAQKAATNPGNSPDPAAAQSKPEKPAVISDVTSSLENGDLVVSVLLDKPAAHKEFTLDKPARLVVDFENADNKAPFFNRAVPGSRVKQIRLRQFQAANPKISRLVFDLEEGSDSHEIVPAAGSVKIVFHDAAAAAEPATNPATDAAPDPAPSGPSQGTSQGPAKSSEAAIQAAAPVTPVIRDLARAEIPVSALETAKKAKPVPAPEAPKPAPPAEPVKPVTAPPPPKPDVTPDAKFLGQPLTLDLVDIPLIDFFRLMAEEGGINVVMDPEVKGNISIKVVKVPWDQIFDAALANNGLESRIEGNLVRIALKKTLQEEAKQQEQLKKASMLAADLETKIKRLNYAKAASFVTALTEQKTPRGTVVVDERTNALILTDLPASVAKMIEMVESLDIPQPQVEIEARIVSSTRDFARDIGVQFGFVQGNLERITAGGPNTFGTIGGTRPSQTPMNAYAAGNPANGRGASQGQATQSGGVSTGNGDNNAGNWNVNLAAQKAFGGLGLSVGNIFDTFLLDAAITAGETKGLAKLISQPKLVVQNNSPGVITQGLRFPVQVVSNNTVTVQFMNAALTLTATPQITYEGNLVLDLKVENNTPDFSKMVNGIPSIHTSESSTRVLVTDGGTTVIGGILIDNETTQEDRVPGLASLPMIGNLFRRNFTSHSTQEVLFFITPRIVK
jgi:type IV pilus secretin PilQ/predicted competence protein